MERESHLKKCPPTGWKELFFVLLSARGELTFISRQHPSERRGGEREDIQPGVTNWETLRRETNLFIKNGRVRDRGKVGGIAIHCKSANICIVFTDRLIHNTALAEKINRSAVPPLC